MNFDVAPRFSSELPADIEIVNRPRQVVGACFSWVSPKSFKNPKGIHIASSLVKELGFEDWDKNKAQYEALLSGQKPFKDYPPYACNYGGHQFGHWAGQLGDGRAITVAEIISNKRHWTLQLKGAGPTPYSRRGDGYAVLRSSIREYLMSEAMHYLGIPSTRALSLFLSGESVMRDKNYDGNPSAEKGAIVCRVAPHFIRFGSFEIHAAHGDKVTLKKLTDYTITHYFPEISLNNNNCYHDFFKAVCETHLNTAVHWQRVGFVHGVLNTDNMSITGETIDYGPFGFLDAYDPKWTPNTTDAQHRRYRFEHQPKIVLWNLLQLANALFLLHDDAKAFENVLMDFQSKFDKAYLKMRLEKLGLYSSTKTDPEFLKVLDDLMESSQIDYTIFHRQLAGYVQEQDSTKKLFGICESAFYSVDGLSKKQHQDWINWFDSYRDRLVEESVEVSVRRKRMNTVNPKYVLRNYMLQEAINEAEKGAYQLIEDFYMMLQKPYEEQTKFEKWYSKKPLIAGAAALSCSS
jgi:uncharacterized protein YdiU (UPF0061 family)